MYTPMQYKNKQELVGTIETNWVALKDSTGAFLCKDGLVRSEDDIQIQDLVRFDSKDPSCAEVIAKYAAQDVELTKVPCFTWADGFDVSGDYEDANVLANALIENGLAKVYVGATDVKYTVAKVKAITDAGTGFVADDVLDGTGNAKFKVASVAEGNGAITELSIEDGGEFDVKGTTMSLTGGTGTGPVTITVEMSLT